MNKFRRNLILQEMKKTWRIQLIVAGSLIFVYFFCFILSTKVVTLFHNMEYMRLDHPEQLSILHSGNDDPKYLQEIPRYDSDAVSYSSEVLTSMTDSLAFVAGISEQVAHYEKIELVAGRNLSWNSEQREVLIPISLADERQIGDRITLNNLEFEVVGIQRSYYYQENFLITDKQFLTDFTFQHYTIYFDNTVHDQPPVDETTFTPESFTSYQGGITYQDYVFQHEYLFVGITSVLVLFFLVISVFNCLLVYRGKFIRNQQINGIKLANGATKRQLSGDFLGELLLLSTLAFVTAIVFSALTGSVQLAEFPIVLSFWELSIGYVLGIPVLLVVFLFHFRWLRKVSVQDLLRGALV